MRERHFSQAQIIHVSRDRGRRCPVSDSLLVASRNEERERERKDNVFGSRRDIYQLCTLPERKTKRIYSIHLSLERLIAAHNVPRAGEDRGGGPFEKTFVKVCGGYLRDRLSFFFPLPLEFNQEINPGGGNPSSGNRAPRTPKETPLFPRSNLPPRVGKNSKNSSTRTSFVPNIQYSRSLINREFE